MNAENHWDSLNHQIINCRRCPRLVQWREQIATVKRRAFRDQDYWGRPVPGFGDQQAKVMVVGLAPGAHGSNRTGRMFTGDASGLFLYSALYQAGIASQPTSLSRDDQLKLDGIFITALCRCAPPANKPTNVEIGNCKSFLQKEIELLNGELKGYVALGRIAFQNLISMYKELYSIEIKNEVKFKHAAFYDFNAAVPWLLASYHPSQQNTQTGRLTRKMFDQIWEKVVSIIGRNDE